MSKRGAQKTGGGNRRARDTAMAADLAKRGVKRTSFRCPITNRIVGIGTVPGQRGIS